MNNNTLGDIVQVTSFGESHGLAVGCVIDGLPAGVHIDIEKVQHAVNMRKTNATSYTSSRLESDTVEILSGIYEGKSLGSPIAIIIKNTNAQSKDYDHLKDVYRPNHADYTYEQKYGIRDHRGGGRSSIRITAAMVAAGAIAAQAIEQISKIQTVSFVQSIGTVTAKSNLLKLPTQQEVYEAPHRCIDSDAQQAIDTLIATAQNTGDTLGGSITTIISGIEAGIGSPIYKKLQSQLAQAMLSINTVKSFEYGDGTSSSVQLGSEHNDAFIMQEGKVATNSNHSGGIQGGISNGADINFTIHFKPISSIAQTQQTVNKSGQMINLEIKGRHDVCAVPRAVPIVQAYTHIVLLNELLKQRLAQI